MRNKSPEIIDSHLALIEDLRMRLKKEDPYKGQNHEDVQIPFISLRLELALQNHVKQSKETFVKQISFGYGEIRFLVAVYDKAGWKIEYWYKSTDKPVGIGQGTTAEQAMIDLLPTFEATNAWNMLDRK